MNQRISIFEYRGRKVMIMPAENGYVGLIDGVPIFHGFRRYTVLRSVLQIIQKAAAGSIFVYDEEMSFH